MNYQVTLTSKGQFTLPKKIRDILGLEPYEKININFNKKTKTMKIEPTKDILDIAGKFKVDPKLLKKYPIENIRDQLYSSKPNKEIIKYFNSRMGE